MRRRCWTRRARELADRGKGIITRVGEFPDFPEEASRARLIASFPLRSLGIAGREGVEGGYFVLRIRGFVGVLPPRETDLIDIQVDAAIRKRQRLYSIGELEGDSPVTVAIRTEPLMVPGTWWALPGSLTRLVDPLFLDRSLQGYRPGRGPGPGRHRARTCAHGRAGANGQAQAAERDRLQIDLRRSERLAALGKLLAGVAHEVRNPLAGIRSTAQLWQRGVVGLDDESLGGLVQEVDRLDGIVGRLLQFSRADAQDLAPGDLNAVVAEAARLARGPAESQGVRRRARSRAAIAPGRDGPAGPAAGLPQPDDQRGPGHARGRRLRLSTRLDPSRRLVQASVADTGPGLDPDVIAICSSRSSRPRPRGPGLGLAIAREIALAHRGDLRAANRPEGRGAVFTITLPAARAASTENPLMDPPATVLVADDDRTIRRNLVRLLRSEGYPRPGGRRRRRGAGVHRAPESPDAVLLDLKMPGRDGLAVLAELGPAWPNCR